MDCRQFLENHTSYVDLHCSAIEEREFQQHVASCQRCARHDTMVRRSLLLVKSLPTIEPSPDFRTRLEARLRLVQPEVTAPRFRPSLSAFAAVAAGLVIAAALAGNALRSDNVIRMAPVVASLPESEPSQVMTPALVAMVPTGMSVWPAIMAASQASVQFVAAELAPER
jgi:anti-sigma factor RsiW